MLDTLPRYAIRLVMGEKHKTSHLLSSEGKRILIGLAERLGISQGHVVEIALRHYDLFWNKDINMLQAQQVQAAVQSLHNDLGDELAKDASAVNWGQIVQILISILQAISPLLTPPTPTV